MIDVERSFKYDTRDSLPESRDINGIVIKPVYTGTTVMDDLLVSNYRYVVDRHNSHCGGCGVNVFDFNTDYTTNGEVGFYNCRLCKTPLYSQSEELIRIVAKRRSKLVQFFKRMWAMLRR